MVHPLTAMKVIYEFKDGKEEKIFDALEWLAAITSYVPNKGEQMVRYYGHYSNASRGLRQKNLDDLIPSILEPEDLKPNHTWARLIQTIYEVDPLTCPKPVLSLSKGARVRCESLLLSRTKR
ncbi:MAG: hypothetical protein A2157_18500 [Deltaproteobacteria bacterium RBG_16_47_11]|nr:MAG: hypothetical protein A2157_18500 [Deltaproteobacteria bacterium RBG_16_47_11]